MLRVLNSRNVLGHLPVFNKLSRNQVPSRCKTKKALDYEKLGSRPPCPPRLPAPPPPPKDDRLFWGMCAIGVCTATFAVFAKSNPEVRDWLSLYAPWFDDIIAFVYEENYTYSEYFECKIKHVTELYNKYVNEEPCQLDAEGNKIEPPKKTKDDRFCKTPSPPVITQDICEVESCLKDEAEDMLNNMCTAKQACVVYNQLVLEYMTEFTFTNLQKLREAMKERKELIETSLNNYKVANEHLDILMEYLDCGVEAPKEKKDIAKEMVEYFTEQTRKEHLDFVWANDEALARDEQWLMVDALVKKYVAENQAVYPTLDYESDSPHIEDPDVFLYNSYRYYKYLKTQLEEAQIKMSMKTDRGLELSLPQDEKSRKSQLELIDNVTKLARAQLENDLKKRFDDLKKRNDDRARNALNDLQQANLKELEEQLEKREEELQSQLDDLVAEKVSAEIQAFQEHRQAVEERVRIVEDELYQQVTAEKEMQRCKDLWIAGNTLLEATDKGDGIVKIQTELIAIEKAGEEDELVMKVLKALPSDVKQNGFMAAAQLRDKYKSAESVARKVALIDQEGAPLPVYFLSWIQDLLLILRLSDIPRAEALEKPLPEISPNLDTFDLLQRSSYWIKKNNISQALRYINALEGASWVVTESWRKNATNYLEIRQAAEALIAHATALGLKHAK